MIAEVQVPKYKYFFGLALTGIPSYVIGAMVLFSIMFVLKFSFRRMLLVELLFLSTSAVATTITTELWQPSTAVYGALAIFYPSLVATLFICIAMISILFKLRKDHY